MNEENQCGTDFQMIDSELTVDLLDNVEITDCQDDQTSSNSTTKILRKKRSINYIESASDSDCERIRKKTRKGKQKIDKDDEIEEKSKLFDISDGNSIESLINDDNKFNQKIKNGDIDYNNDLSQINDLNSSEKEKIDDKTVKTKMRKRLRKNCRKHAKNSNIITIKPPNNGKKGKNSILIIDNSVDNETSIISECEKIVNSPQKSIKNEIIIEKKGRGRPKKKNRSFTNNNNNDKSIRIKIDNRRKNPGRPKKLILSTNDAKISRKNVFFTKENEKIEEISQNNIDFGNNDEKKRTRGRPPRNSVINIEEGVENHNLKKSIDKEEIVEELHKSDRRKSRKIKNDDYLMENQSLTKIIDDFEEEEEENKKGGKFVKKSQRKFIESQKVKKNNNNNKVKIDKRVKIDKTDKINNIDLLKNNDGKLDSLRKLAELEELYRKLEEEHEFTKDALRKTELQLKESANKKKAKNLVL